jgi:AraC-like DNA-binding protein
LALTGSTSLPVKTLAPPVKRPSAKEPNGGRGGPRPRSAPAPVSSAGVIPVDLAFATGQVDPPDRLAAWRELISRVFLRLAITPIGDDGQPGTFGGMVAGHSVGEVRVWRVAANPMSAVRSRRHIRTSASDDYLLALHVRGTAHATQDGREVTLGPGDFALSDSSRPYSIAFPGPGVFEHVIYQVPRASLDARRQLREATALRVSAATAALAHLGDPGLSPQAVARARYISARQLHRLFAREGLTFGGWIREERLRRCQDDLTSQQLAHLPVAQIAARWGFRSPAHFARAFQARYGITPTGRRRTRTSIRSRG